MRRWTMKAGRTDLDGLILQTVPTPEPGPGEVRVRVQAVSLNQRDLIVLGTPELRASGADLIPVADGAGIIDAVGAGVTNWSVGDRVMSLYFRGRRSGPPTADMGFGPGSGDIDGFLAEQVVLPADVVLRAPESLTSDEAATLPCAGVTAWTALQLAHPVGPEDRVLTVGTGGVSLIAAVLARALGAEVFATTSRDDKRAPLEALGVAGVVNYADTPDWGRAVADLTGGVDKVVNAAGLGSVNQSIDALKPGGEVAVMGLFTQGDALDPMQFLAKAVNVRGVAVGSAEDQRALAVFVDTHGVKPPIGARFTFDQARDAFEALRSGVVFGKIVIAID